MRSSRKSRSIEALEGRYVLDSTLVFNEIMYNPSGGSESLEWVELYNQMGVDLDVSDWRLDNAVDYEFPAGTVVRGGGYLVVAANPTALATAGVFNGALGPWTGSLANDGERIELKNNSDREMDAMKYGDNGDWSSGPDGSGATLAKTDPLSASEPAANWRTSRLLEGSPGAVNVPPPGEINLADGVVSYWNFDEASGRALDRADSNHGTLGAGATRVAGNVGTGAISFDDTPNAYVNVGHGSSNNFAATAGVTIEALVTPSWDATGVATIFRKNESIGAPLISYWSFDETNGTPANANVLDPFGGNSGVLAGTAAHTSGIRGLGAGRFNDASGEAVTLGPGVGNNFSVTAGVTIAAWIKPEWTGNTLTFDTIFYKNDASTRMSLEFQRDSANTGADPPVAGTLPQVLSFGLNTGGTIRELDMPLGVNLAALPNGTANAGTIYLTAPGGALGPNDVVLRDGNAHHVAATYDVATGEKAIWIDAVKRWFRNYAAGTAVATGGTTAAAIGNLAAGSSRAFKGVIDELAIWGDALTATQIAALAGTTLPPDVPSATGVNNAVQLSFQNDGNNAAANPPVAAGPVLSFGLNVGGVYGELDMPLDGLTGQPTLAALQNGQPHHLAATYDVASGEKAIWIDGAKLWSVNLGAGAALQLGGDGLATIGNRGPAGGESFDGVIDEVAYWERRLSTAEAQGHASDALTGRNYFAPLNAAPTTLAWNETAAAGAGFFVEIANTGTSAVDLAGHLIVGSEAPTHRRVLPAQTLPVGGFTSLSAAQLGFAPADGERLFLLDANELAVIDSVKVDNELRGRYPDGTGPWMHPTTATPGAANDVDVHDEIVINEILYHARPQFAKPIELRTTRPVSLGSTWQYEQSNTDLSATNWRAAGFIPAGWSTGAATFGATSGAANYAALIQSDSPLAYWRLGDAGPAFADSSGNNHGGTADAGVLFGRPSLLGNEPANTAVNTVGTARATVPGFEKFPAGSTGYSVEYWIKLNAAPTGFHNIVGDGESGGDFYLMNYLTGGSQIRPHFNGAGTVSTDSTTTLQVGPTYHIVTTWDRATGLGSIYINGVLDKSVSVGSGAPVNSNNPVYLGRDNREPGGNFVLDEVAIYNRALSAAEISEHYAAGGGVVFATPLTLGPTTYYFRQEFTFAGNPANTTLALRSMVDDGAVFYLNGQEIYRQNMPAGAVGHGTLASTAVTTATLGAAVPITATLNAGVNVLAVEVHQAAMADTDAAFAAELIATETLTAATPFAESDEEWIELYNRGSSPVDLSGWQLDDAVNYTFPPSTTLNAGEYLVVANNSATLGAKYPGIRILGDYGGRLANSSERIQLKDDRKNLADEVTYASDGRWSSYPDGGGTSLELRDPDADNSLPEAWAASNESSRSTWRTYTYRGVAANPPNSNNPATYNEFILGLLDAGVVLLDDISVRENPSGAATQFIQNGTFQADTLGGAANKWRIVGNHHGTVIADPDNAANKVLRLVANGPAEHMANHAETTLKAGTTFETVMLGTEYEISFRAKWIAGSPQLNTRLFFNLLPKTTILDVPAAIGTPGAKNSVLGPTSEAAANIGPAYRDLAHTPITPAAGESVAVSVAASDPNGVASLSLRYSVNGAAFVSLPMLLDVGRYSATIPGQAANAVVQFYVEGQDSLGAISTFPADGAASRALYKVGNSTNSATLHNLQIIMTAADTTLLGASTNLMSNDLLGATVVYQGRTYYDVGIRLKGSEHGRPDLNRRGFFLVFPPDNLFRGVHRSIGIDRSGGWRYGRQFGQEEILIHHFINRAGDVPGSYNDLVFVEAPGVATNTAILQMGRFTNLYLDSQFDNGGDGTRYEYELVYTMLPSVAGDVESLKAAQEGPSVFGVAIRDQGDDREAYRNTFLIKNNLDRDDYTGVMDMAEAFSLPTGSAAYHQRTGEVLDVDEWLRAYAAVALAAVSDSYFNNSNAHNATFYRRPEDGKMLLFPQDMDFAFINGATSSLVANNDLSGLLTRPNNSHFYLGHIHDIVTTSFNQTYMAPWVAYYNSLLPGQNITDLTAFINSRATFALGQLPAQVAFDVAATPPTPISTTLIQEFASATALVPSMANGGSALGTSWTAVGFNDDTWAEGSTGIGYENSPSDAINYANPNLLNLDASDMFNVNGSVFIRVPFSVAGNPADFDALKLRMKYDDGFIAYLNGVKVAEANAPASPAWDSLATAAHDDAQAVVFQEFDISAFRNLLVAGGNNVLAFQGLNTSLGSSDLLVLPELIAQEFPDAGGGEIVTNGPTATLGGTGWINVREIKIQGQSTPVPAVWQSNTAWQATISVQPGTHVVTFEAYDFRGNLIGTDSVTITSTVPRPLIDHLRISELMYHPADPTPAEAALVPGQSLDADDFEFIDLVNTSATMTLTLTGARFDDGIEFTFPVATLAPGARTVLVSNPAAFQARYGSSIPIAGTYTGALNNAGEHLLLVDADGGSIHDFTYDDTGVGWHPTTDGLGYSLVIVSENGPVAAWNDGAAWRPSHELGGSPGERDLIPGDVNGDDRVDTIDAGILQANLGAANGATRAQGDLNRDGAVNRVDAVILALHFGSVYLPPSPSPAAPSTVMMVSRDQEPKRTAVDRPGRGQLSLRVARRTDRPDNQPTTGATDIALAELDTVSTGGVLRAVRRTSRQSSTRRTPDAIVNPLM